MMPKKSSSSSLTTTPDSLTVTGNSGPTPIGILAPTDLQSPDARLTITVTGLPTDGTVLLSKGTPIFVGETLTVNQLTGLLFEATPGLFGTSSTFTYNVTDPSGTTATGAATLSISPDSVPPVTTLASVTVAENAAATPIGIAAPTDPNYSASQLTVTVTGLPTDGTVLLSDGVTAVSNGATLTVAQLTGLMFKPTAWTFGTSSTFTYKVTDPSGLSTSGSATLAIAPDSMPPVTTPTALTVAGNAAATFIGIVAPTDPNYSASQLSVTVTGLPGDGTVLLADGVTAVTSGEALTVAQLTGLMFKPAANLFSQSSVLTYTVTDPSGLSATGAATLAIAADTTPPTTTNASLTVAENASVTTIGIAAPTDPNYSASQLSVTVTELPTDGSVVLSDGTTPVILGQTLSVAALTGLMFHPTAGLFSTSSTFAYTVTDPSGLSASGAATLAIGADTMPPVTTDPALTVAPNSGATPMLIPAPTDPNYSASQLSVAVTGLPSDGTVLLSDGVTAVTPDETLTVAQLTGLMFEPTTGLSSQSSTFTYTITDPANLSTPGSETLVISAGSSVSQDGSTLTAGSAGSLVTSAGTWTFSTTTAAGGYEILLNGLWAASGSAVELMVANGGNLYANNSAGAWYEWVNNAWSATSNPTSTSTTSTATTLSPDGSILKAGSGGSLVNSAGAWTFSTTTAAGGYEILLNGLWAANGSAVELMVANGGNLYANNSTGTWYEWVNNAWSATSNPISTSTTSTATALSPGGSILEAGPGGSLVNSAGTWTFSTASAAGGDEILLNGQSAGNGYAVTLEVASQGQMYARNSASVWYEWVNSGWVSAKNPNSITTNSPWLEVAPNGGAQPIGIAVPTDSYYTASQLDITVNLLPTNGVVLQSDGVTPVYAGEQLTVTQLSGLQFRPNPGISGQSAAFAYTVTDPSGASLSGNAGFQILSTGAWRDPPGGASPTTGLDVAPNVAQPSQTGDIVGVRLQNTGAVAENAGYVTFGEVFLPGTVKTTDSLVAWINGVSYAVQMDVKSTNADGSVRQAILTLDAPSIPAGGTLDLMLAKGTTTAPSPAAPNASALLANGYNLSVDFTFHNPDGTITTNSASAAAALQAAISGGAVSTWLSGPEVNEYDVATTVDGGKLKVEFDIRAYANGMTTTDVIFDNSWMFSSGKTDLNYDVSMSQAGQQVYSATGVQQWLYSLWDHQVASAGTISPNVQYDVPYLMATGATQRYDTSFGVSDALIQYNYSGLNATDTGPMGPGTVATYMPSTGGRQDIGPQPNWTAQWLLSQDANAYQVMMANANASGGVPWHYTDESTGESINGETYPNFGSPNAQNVTLSPANGWPEMGSGGSPAGNGDPWVPDAAHMPDLNYLPYLATGSHYQLDLLQAEADYAIYAVQSYGETYDSSNTVPMGLAASFVNIPGANPGADTSSNGNQIRALAWELRSEAEAAYITPDSDPLKTYFVNELDKAMTGFVQEYIADNVNGQYGQLNGFVEGSSGPGNGAGYQLAPWEESYFVTSLGEVAGMNIPEASAKAIQMLQYMNNFISGLFTNGTNGYNPLDGTAEWLQLSNPTTRVPYTTWSQLANGNQQANGPSGYNGVYAYPTEFMDWPTQTMGGYPALAKAALADEITYTQSPQAIQAYGLVVSQMAYAFSLDPTGAANAGGGPTLSAAYQNYPQFSIVPRLPDGSWLENSQMRIDTSNAATVSLTSTGGDSLLAVVGNGTATLTGGTGTCDLLYGGGGPTTLVAGTGNDYMFGGGTGSSYVYNSSGALEFGVQQATTFVDGTGNDYMYGGPGTNTYVFKVNNSAGARSTTIANFNVSTDQLQVAANLDGNGITSASQLLAGATVSNGNTVLHLSPDDAVTLLGISSPSSLLNHLIVS